MIAHPYESCQYPNSRFRLQRNGIRLSGTTFALGVSRSVLTTREALSLIRPHAAIGGSVFTRDLVRGERVAQRIETSSGIFASDD